MKKLILTIFQTPKFSKNLFITVFLTIITFCIGIVTHETGHAITGKVFAYKNIKLSYKSTFMESKYHDSLKSIRKLRKYEIKNHLNYPEKQYYREIFEIPTIYIYASACVLTFLIGFVSLLLLYFNPHLLHFQHWFSYFIFYPSLFLGQFISDGIVLLITTILDKPITMDLIVVASLLYLPRLSLVLFMFILSTVMLCYLFFKLMPVEKRAYLILGICLGTIIGRILWFGFLGQILLPA
jgi:hypothetical protein